MKKLIAALTLMLAFSINANAQDKKANPAYELGKKQATELTEFLGLDKIQTENFARLFEQKINVLNDQNLSQEKKDEFSGIVEAKIRASLDPKQMERLQQNEKLLKELTH